MFQNALEKIHMNWQFQHDNAAHRARKTKDKLQDMDSIEVLPQPAYGPDIASSDYGLFRSMAHFLRGRHYVNVDNVGAACRDFFASKTKDRYRHQIELLAERWVKVIENDGLYFEEWYFKNVAFFIVK